MTIEKELALLECQLRRKLDESVADKYGFQRAGDGHGERFSDGEIHAYRDAIAIVQAGINAARPTKECEVPDA